MAPRSSPKTDSSTSTRAVADRHSADIVAKYTSDDRPAQRLAQRQAKGDRLASQPAEMAGSGPLEQLNDRLKNFTLKASSELPSDTAFEVPYETGSDAESQAESQAAPEAAFSTQESVPINEAKPATGKSSPDTTNADSVRTAMQALRPSQQVVLLDAIDSLRQENISTSINVPQIVVCGDQSSGKSAVLEAISRLPFRSGAETTTRFPTELVLRNGPDTSLHVSIDPHEDRDETDRERLRSFTMTAKSLDDFEAIHETASQFLGNSLSSPSIWFDRLRIEVTGPEQPHLTLVDLPGLIHNTSNKLPSIAIASIKALTVAYMKAPRTIILAVVNASYDLALQHVLELITDDTKGRTLGIITHPDGIQTIDATGKWLQVANNKTTMLGLGWHVVCNLNHESKDRTAALRDQHEMQFFSKGVWKQLDSRLCGVGELRSKLNRHLFTLIQEEMPALLEDVGLHMDDCEQVLKACGPARDNIDSRRRYLLDMSTHIHSCLAVAVNGSYASSTFADFFEDRPSCCLRDNVRLILEEFSKMMWKSKACVVYTDVPTIFGTTVRQPLASKDPSIQIKQPAKLPTSSHEEPANLPTSAQRVTEVTESSRVELREFCAIMVKQSTRMRGQDLPGVVPRDMDRLIFRKMSKQWREISAAYTRRCCDALSAALEHIFVELAGQHTGLLLWKECVEIHLLAKRVLVEQKLEELLWPYEQCQPMTYRNDFAERVDGDILVGRRSEPFKTWAKHADNRYGFDRNMVAVAKALDLAEVYYDVALETLVENVALLAVERILLAGIQDIVAPGVIACLGQDRINIVGRETADCEAKRTVAERQLAVLENVEKICRRYTTSFL